MTSHPGFISVPNTGVIYVLDRAAKAGYKPYDASWCNLGQGAPEAGPLTGAPERIKQIIMTHGHNEYAPVAGQQCLREKVAELYNIMYRRGKKSQYTYRNVSISGGGRIALSRVITALGNINLGHIVPDYTAYAELLAMQKTITPIPILLYPEDKYQISPAKLKEQIIGLGLRALLMSNPCNPTGQVVTGNELNELIHISRQYQCSFIMDEFYSHYLYETCDESNNAASLSAAEFIDDVNQDNVIIINGLTKNWRYPGWRLGWTIGPEEIINSIVSAGSFQDGGANNPLQFAAMPLLDVENVKDEITCIQKHFRHKRDYLLKRLTDMGITYEAEPQGSFYVWTNLSKLPSPLNDAMKFFEAGLEHNVITVPGVFFDINPGGKRKTTRFSEYCRISFGPEMPVLEKGLDALEKMINVRKRVNHCQQADISEACHDS